MKATQSATNHKETLIQYIMNLNNEQAAKLMKRLPQVEKLLNMTDSGCTFTETLTDRIFGNC